MNRKETHTMSSRDLVFEQAMLNGDVSAWVQKCAQRIKAITEDWTEPDCFSVASACAGVEFDEHGLDVSKWQDPSEAADNEIDCWTDG